MSTSALLIRHAESAWNVWRLAANSGAAEYAEDPGFLLLKERKQGK